MIKNFLEPLNITHLGKNYIKEDLSVGYVGYTRSRSTEPYPDNAVFPYFSVSTVEDVYKLSQEYLDPKIMPAEVVDGLRKEIHYLNGTVVETIDLIGKKNWPTYKDLDGRGSTNRWTYTMGYSGAQFISFDDQIVIIIFTKEGPREYTELLETVYVALTAD